MEQHRRKRDQDAIVLCHRGARDLAPENTLSAYTAALKLGADGIEIDIRRTRDGILVCFHDDTPEGHLDAPGTHRIGDFFYEELCLYRFTERYGPQWSHEAVPTLEDVFDLVRSHSALLHLDLKEAGIERSVLLLLERYKLWDGVVWVNENNARLLRTDKRISMLPWKGGFLENEGDCDPDLIEKTLQKPGQLLIADDPRCLLDALHRPVGTAKYVPPSSSDRSPAPPLEPLIASLLDERGQAADPNGKPLPGRLAAARLVRFWGPETPALIVARFRPGPSAGVRANIAWTLGMCARHQRATATAPARKLLLMLIEDESPEVRAEAARALACTRTKEAIPHLLHLLEEGDEQAHIPSQDMAEEAARQAATAVREAAAWALGELGDAHERIVSALTQRMERRIVHGDYAFMGADGAAAARALGKLKASSAVPSLAAAIYRIDPALETLKPYWLEKGYPAFPAAWWDYRLRSSAIAALGCIDTPASRSVLIELLEMPDDQAHSLHPSLKSCAAAALARDAHDASRARMVELLKHPHVGVRRQAFLALISRPGPKTRSALLQLMTLPLRDERDAIGHAMSLQTLGWIGPRSREEKEAMLQSLKSPFARVRRQAVWAVGRCHMSSAKPHLKTMARSDPDERVRRQAEAALRFLGWKEDAVEAWKQSGEN